MAEVVQKPTPSDLKTNGLVSGAAFGNRHLTICGPYNGLDANRALSGLAPDLSLRYAITRVSQVNLLDSAGFLAQYSSALILLPN